MSGRVSNTNEYNNEIDIKYEMGTSDRKVYENLLEIQNTLEESFNLMKQHLTTRPMERLRNKYFKMRYKNYEDAWEYRVNRKIRVYLIVYPSERRVYIFGAGAHPNGSAPTPPKSKNILWSRFLVV
ncbi:unnamed protein product [Adineta ricciae]|uniref:Uncharacterized protein n=1 Tax=Adineta ricciae TaxID=249248 RepID=A0A815R6P9_ADIRI|nr:unnamed protein product [Adineta ricciae]